jgi:hypothetical protein
MKVTSSPQHRRGLEEQRSFGVGASMSDETSEEDGCVAVRVRWLSEKEEQMKSQDSNRKLKLVMV